MAEKLVSGSTVPLTFTLARPQGAYDGPPELSRVARTLYRTACGLERGAGGPQDIEWAIAGRQPYILQSRPITTLVGYKPTPRVERQPHGQLPLVRHQPGRKRADRADSFHLLPAQGLVYDGMDPCEGSTIGVDGYPLAGIIGGRGM